MKNTRSSPFSFPPKIIALVLAFLSLLLLWFTSTRLVYGSINVNVAAANAFVRLDVTDAPVFDAPQAFRLKPGRHFFVVGAPGRIGQRIKETVYPFWSRTVMIKLLPDLTYESERVKIEYHSDRQAFLIVPKVELTGLADPQSQIAAQWDTYRQGVEEALMFIRSRRIDPKTVPLEFWAKEWWPANKSITVN